jgi:hypothetical protein
MFQHFSIPFFHSDETNRLPLINLYFRKVIKFRGVKLGRGVVLSLLPPKNYKGDRDHEIGTPSPVI